MTTRRPTHMYLRRNAVAMILGIAALTGCGADEPDLVATVSGTVEQGPTCPVETLDSPCPPAPAPGATVEVLQEGDVVASTTADAGGHFELGAPVGVVEVQAKSVDGLPSQDVATFTLSAGDDVQADFLLDTGIR